MNGLKPALTTIPRFREIPFLHHGFGGAGWNARDFRNREGWRDFRWLFLRQVHSDRVHFLRSLPEAPLTGDAAVTSLPLVFLAIKTADCLPVLLVDEKKQVIAAVHCGWRGTLKRLLGKLVAGMKAHFRCDPASILAGFGPCISASCYEVGTDVRESYAAAGFPESLLREIPGRPRKYLFDLAGANRLQLLGEGVKDTNIFSVNVCTHCDPRYPSYRRDKDATGRMLSFIGMAPAESPYRKPSSRAKGGDP